MYTITGATGNTGRMIAEMLLARGEKVRVIGRSAEKLQPLVDKGAEAIVADLMDTEAITKAFTGVKAVYIMLPPNLAAENIREYQNRIGRSLATAIKNSRVKHVVNLSSMGAHLSEGVGVVNGLYDQEQRLNKLDGVNLIHLRPTFFMENNFMQIETIKNNGIMGSPTNPDLPQSQIATKDVADFAFERLMKLDFEGKSSRELLGAREVTMNEIASVFGKAIGKDDLKFMQFSYEDTQKAMIGMGLSEDVAGNMVELYRAFNEGTCQPTEARVPENTTPTTIEDFAPVFAQIYNG